MATDQELNRGAGAFSTPGVDQPGPVGPAGIITTHPVVKFKLQDVEPPSRLYLSQSERLMLSAINSDPNVTQVNLQGRLLRASDGQITPFVLAMNVASDRSVARQMFDITEGYLLGAKVPGSGGTTRGRCYVSLDVARGDVPTRTLYQQLIAGYISRGCDMTWPDGEYSASVESSGWARAVAGTTPAAGAEIVETVPTTARWRLKSLRFRLVTSAAVANRSVRIILDDGANPFYIGGFNLVQAATVTEDYSAGIGVTGVVDAGSLTVTASLPDNLLFAGFRWRTTTVNLQAADQFSFVEYGVEEWIEL